MISLNFLKNICVYSGYTFYPVIGMHQLLLVSACRHWHLNSLPLSPL